jgi:4-alpha-glucanotransferase
MRASGVLLPIFSLPGKYGIGCFSKEAYRFVDFLELAGQSFWQILPLGPTSYGDSPYQSFSTFAGNPYFISLEELVEQGLLTEADCEKADFGNVDASIDYGQLYQARFEILKKAFKNKNLDADEEYKKFLTENDFWIHDYSEYMAIKNHFQDQSWNAWDEDIRLRKPEALSKYREKLAEEISFYCFLQYEFYREWKNLKQYANEKGIRIIGDIPIYVSYDSADVWANPELFQLDQNGEPVAVAGCPPDGFAPTGQLWGNPIYDWDYHKKTNYEWWTLRMTKCAELYDVIRIDHFRGFDQFYSIPYPAKTAEKGKWVDGPGIELFHHLDQVLGDAEIIAEDLGFITKTVKKLVSDTGYPNMKVVEFAFDARDTGSANDYLPHNYGENCVAYTGTHDNETLMGWLKGIPKEDLLLVAEYVDGDAMDAEDLARRLIRILHASSAKYCIIPLQDYLYLDNRSRINTPSTLGNNWKWRASESEINGALAKRIRKVTQLFGRLPVISSAEDEEEASEEKDKEE